MISTKFQYQTKKVLVLSLIINHAASAFNGPLLQGRGSTAFLKHVSPQEQTQLFSLASDSNEINPSSEFGSPISEKNAELNRATVTFIKSAVFGNLFVGADRDYARFYALETIARMPYFSYLSVLHLYETLGWWRKAKYMKIHFAESWNELHHLLIMESLGGNEKWGDRFVAQHIAFGYYWAAVFLYMFNPTMAYNLNEAVEEHAFLTYDGFLKENEEKLKKYLHQQLRRNTTGMEICTCLMNSKLQLVSP